MEMRGRHIYIEEIGLSRVNGLFKAAICCCNFSRKPEYEELIQYLGAQERLYCDKLNFDKRRQSFLIGRFSAKKAVAELIGEDNLRNAKLQ